VRGLHSLIAGVDIGGTKLAVGVTNLHGEIVAERRQPSDVKRGPDAVVSDVIAMVHATVVEAGGSRASLAFLGVASPGPLSQARGVILSTPNMPGWENYPLIERLASEFGCLTVLENDANAACLGEALFGAGMGERFVAYFTISTGVGGGFVQDGRVLRGKDGNAAEFGHQIIVPFNGAECGCHRFGHLEAYANGKSIVRRALEAMEAGAESTVMDHVPQGANLTTRELAAAANAGDALAKRIWDETGDYLAIGIVNVVQSFNPGIVVLGGGVTKVGDLLFEPTRRYVDERIMVDYKGTFTIEPAKLEDRVGVMGAVGLALEHGVLHREAA
jgi:glucokinase